MAYFMYNGGMKGFKPDNTAEKLYIQGDCCFTFQEIQDKILAHFGHFNVQISSEHIQTKCIGYDQYDPWDYENYIVIETNSYS